MQSWFTTKVKISDFVLSGEAGQRLAHQARKRLKIKQMINAGMTISQ